MSKTDKDLYALLNVSRQATTTDIVKAYTSLSSKFQNESDVPYLKELTEAFEILSSEEKRATYDKYGYNAFQAQQLPPRDSFEVFFGERNPFGDKRSPYGVEPIPRHAGYPPAPHHVVPSTGYPPGYTPNVPPTYPPSSHHTIPSSGYPPGYSPPLNASSGYTPSQHVSSHSSQLSQSTKNASISRHLPCSLEELYCGKVKKFSHEKKVYDKDGKYTIEKKDLEIQLKPGWKAGTQVTFPNEGDVIPGYIPADVIIYIEEEPHPLFKRDQNNLHFKKEVTLLEALTGLPVVIPLLNGEEYSVYISGPITPNFSKLCPEKGYLSQRDGSKGDLIIHFDILWPKELSDEDKQELKGGPLGRCNY